MNPRSLALLLTCNLIWSFHPMFGKVAMETLSPAATGWLRYGSAAVAYFFVAFATRIVPSSPRPVQLLVSPRSWRDGLLIALLGIAPFAFSPILQLEGLAKAQSIDNAIIIAMEPIMTVLLAWIVLRERLRVQQWIAFSAAFVGFVLLSGVKGALFPVEDSPSFLPFFLMLFALWGEAAYSVLGRKLTQSYSALPLYGTAITLGALVLTAYAYLADGFPVWGEVSARSLFAILWLGPLGTTLAYILWIRTIQQVPVAAAALTLFVQPLFGTVLGITVRDETFSFTQSLGAALILVAVGVQSWWEATHSPLPSSSTLRQ